MGYELPRLLIPCAPTYHHTRRTCSSSGRSSSGGVMVMVVVVVAAVVVDNWKKRKVLKETNFKFGIFQKLHQNTYIHTYIHAKQHIKFKRSVLHHYYPTILRQFNRNQEVQQGWQLGPHHILYSM